MPDAARPVAIVADDEPRLAAYLVESSRSLCPNSGRAVAGNGPEALAAIDAQAPDVPFLDIRMPGLTGLDGRARGPPIGARSCS